ncbi:MAG TPA: hypothetical protein VJC01_00475 [Candidatus Paceibacterota bacterium]
MAPLNQKIKLIFFAVLIGAAVVFFASSIAKMQENTAGSPNIQFPVKELGGCESENDCKSYCNKPQNIEACVDFAEKHNLIPQEELEMAKKFIAAGKKGPDGCDSKESCENYCNDANNIEKCIAFGEENGLIPPDELEEAKKVRDALRKGAQLPGGCKNKKNCDAYCGASEHMEECIAFAEAAGFIPPEELGNARKALEAMKKGVKPPPCRGKAECDTYCAKPGNFEACIVFAEAAGFVSSEESAMARKTGGKGPGDCRGKEECESFCQNPDNQETCFNFGKEHGLIPEEDLREMEEGKQKMKEGLLNAPPEVLECLTNAFGNEFIEKLKTGTAIPSRDMGDKMRGCFEKMSPPDGSPGEETPPEGGKMMRPPEEAMPPEGFGPWEGFQQLPEGFKPPEDYQRPPEGFQPPQGFGPGSSAEECAKHGGNWDGSRCDFRVSECAKQGGAWDGSKCSFINPMDTAEGCIKQGGNWLGSMCGFGAKVCIEQGGVWDGSRCNFTQPQTLLQYSPFGAILNIFLGR